MSRLRHSEKIILQACRLCISQSHSRAGWGTQPHTWVCQSIPQTAGLKPFVHRTMAIANCFARSLSRSSSSPSPVFGRTPNAGPESSRVVLTDVGMAQMTKEGQAPLTDSMTGAVVPYVTEPHHWRQNSSNGYGGCV